MFRRIGYEPLKQRGAFISYSRRDKDFAVELARELRAAGYLVWLDQLDIPTGARWDDEVEKALREHEIFLGSLSGITGPHKLSERSEFSWKANTNTDTSPGSRDCHRVPD